MNYKNKVAINKIVLNWLSLASWVKPKFDYMQGHVKE